MKRKSIKNRKITLEEWAFRRTAVSNCGRLSVYCVRDLAHNEIANQIQWYGGLKRNQPGVGIFRFTYLMCLREMLLRKKLGIWKMSLQDKQKYRRPFRNKCVTRYESFNTPRPFSQ